MELKQVALVAGQLTGVRQQLFDLLGLEQDFADPGVGEFGLCNSVMAIGDTFLEVVAPLEANTAAGRLLERRGGDGGYMVLVGVDDIDACTARMAQLGIRKVWSTQQDSVNAFHVHPRDIGAAIVSFDQMVPADHWEWAGPDWESRVARHVSAITAVDIQAVDAASVAGRWSQALDKPVLVEGDPEISAKYVIKLDRGKINFMAATDGRGDGVAAVEFDVSDAEGLQQSIYRLGLTQLDGEVIVCGTRLRFRQN